jgi:uncharacterized protein YegJ (DUF2314 family)
MMRKIRRLLLEISVISIALALRASCSKEPKEEMVSMSSLRAQSIHFQYAIYYLPLPSRDPSALLPLLLADEKHWLKVVNEMEEAPNDPLVHAYSCDKVQEKYAPPDVEYLQLFGRGLTREQAEKLHKCERAFIMDFGHPGRRVWEALQTANRVAEMMARETGGLLWDEETREVFRPDEWHKRRVASWTDLVPNVSDHTTIHSYKSDEYVRAITLGMSKFGLPDVVIEDFSWSLNRNMGNLINSFCQSMAEGAVVKESGPFDLEMESLKSNSTAVALLTLKKGTWEEGDPKNRLIEIAFDRYSGSDVHARQENMLSSLFGWEDRLTTVRHDEQLLAASRNAKAKLPMLYKAFTKGLEPGEFILVKAPFETTDGGNEWMWVEITAWKGNKIKGLLKNEPSNIPSLHGGQLVEVKQEDVFDYMRHYPDGREEGNETGAIIEKMQAQSEKQ